MKRNIASVILAGGKGKRIRCSSVHKVCFSLGGKPAINRTIETLDRCGIRSHLIVVGHLAEQVMQTVSSAPGTHYFCYQVEPIGTGNAAKAAACMIENIPSTDAVLVIAGDKIIEESIIRKLVDRFDETRSDLAFIAGKISDFPGSGRIIETEEGTIDGIIEVPDINKYFTGNNFSIVLNGRNITPVVISAVKHVNLSVYLFKKEAFLSSIKNIGTDNAQKEEYLTDAVGILAGSGAKVTMLTVENPRQVMSFNTPEEMMETERRITRNDAIFTEERSCTVRKPADWLGLVETRPCLEYLHGIYGSGYPHVEKKRSMLTAALKEYLHQFGNTPAAITRAPGRINLMGRHIDHQGGDVNMMAVDKDIYCIAGERNDRRILARSMEPAKFPDRDFSIDELETDTDSDWNTFIDSLRVRTSANQSRGDWGQYVRAVIARFQHFRDKKPLKGMNLLISGDLPAGGGISSSSALFVSIAEACVSLNGLKVTPELFVELCGEGERYVGTRGGNGDHAAIKYSQKGAITHMGLYPLRKIKTVSFPDDCVIAICNSRRQAHKTRGAKNIYNQRVACYHTGLELLRRKFPDRMNTVAYLRDMVYGKQAFPEKLILSMMLDLPQKIGIKEILKKATDGLKMRLEGMPESLNDLPVREVFIYGLAECLRSRLCSELISEDGMREFGRLTNISHDGDRVVRWTGPDTTIPFSADYSDKNIKKLAGLAESSRNNLLLMQPGSYRCSIPEIDKMVDISLSVKDVYGAQISGAGLGGCTTAVLKKTAYENICKRLNAGYYEPLKLEPEIFIVHPSEGSGPVSF